MNRKKLLWILPMLAVSAVLLAGTCLWHREAAEREGEDDILVSEEGSFHAGDLELVLSNESGAPIYYTLDGSVPSLESARYTEPLLFPASDIVSSCVLRACSFDEAAGTWGRLFTRTYFYAEEEEAFQRRFSTRIVCVTSDPAGLYDHEYGILVEGRVREEYQNSEAYDPELLTQPANFTQKGRDWEREAHIEILTADGQRVIDQDAGIRVFGHASRQSYRKSLKLYAREEYGAAEFACPLFPDNVSGQSGRVQEAYERLVLRNHGTDKSVTLFREELFQTLCARIQGVDHKSVAPVAVYLNGEYYNFEWIQEVYDDRYMEENYGGSDRGHYEIVTASGDVEEEDLTREELRAQEDYRLLKSYGEKDLTDERTFGELCALVDIENLLQYFAIETYIANWDWPQNNIKLYRYYAAGDAYGEGRQDGRWRYLYYDMEAGFNLYNDPREDLRSIRDAMEENSLFGAVMKRRDMQERFAFYLDQCIQEYFTEERVREAVRALQELRDQELSESIAFKKSQDETYALTMEEIGNNIEIIYDFVETRPEDIREQMETLFGIRMEERR
ncbi:MAG: hypothetical protein HFI15_00940 [Lachnospiraceae bacterium]|jgi:hypothetical protein|nr:hypothetical protein [Lachnospiraceae bacterium]